MLDDRLALLINKTNSKLKNTLLQQVKQYDITAEQWGLLNFITSYEGITPKELSDLTLKDKPNTNRILQKLAARGAIIRQPHPTDKRAYQLYLTPSGRKLHAELVPLVKTVLDNAQQNLSTAEKEQLTKLLTKIYTNL